MMSMVVVADSDATQLTWLPFRPSLMGLINTLDISGKLRSAEILAKVNMEEPITTGVESTPVVPTDEMVCKLVAAPRSGFVMSSHECDNPDVVLHVSSSWSPTWHTGATIEGEISTNPENLYHGYFENGMSCGLVYVPFTKSALDDRSKASSATLIVNVHQVAPYVLYTS